MTSRRGPDVVVEADQHSMMTSLYFVIVMMLLVIFFVVFPHKQSLLLRRRTDLPQIAKRHHADERATV